MDMKIAALLAAITFVPGIGYIYINDMMAQPFAWLALVGLGCGQIAIWAAVQGEDHRRQSLMMLAGCGFLTVGLVAIVMMGI